MYSNPAIQVDKGLGFDFSGIADLAKSAATVGLNIFNKQMELKQVKVLAEASKAGGYGVPAVTLPSAQMYNPQPTFGQPMYVPPPTGGMSMTTMLLLAGIAVGGIILYRSR